MFRLLALAVLLLAAKAHAASPSGSTITSTGSLTDATGNTWTLSQTCTIPASAKPPCVFENAKPAGTSYNVVALEYCAGIYHQNTSNLWYLWNGTGWTASLAPNCSPPPPSITLNVTGALQIVCPVTLANLLAAINTNMQCVVTVTSVNLTSQ